MLFRSLKLIGDLDEQGRSNLFQDLSDAGDVYKEFAAKPILGPLLAKAMFTAFNWKNDDKREGTVSVYLGKNTKSAKILDKKFQGGKEI